MYFRSILKNKKAIYLLFAANSISGFAQGISMISIPWYFSNTIFQPSLYGKIYWIVTVISIFWGLYVGSLVDQYNRKRLFVTTSVIGAIILLSASFSGYYYDIVPMGMVAVVFASTIFIFNIHYPNLYAFAHEISEAKDYGKITSYIEVQGQTASAFAGAFAAILMKGTENEVLNVFGFKLNLGFTINPWTLQEIFLLDGISYVVAAILISTIIFTPIALRYKEQESILNRLQVGVKYLWQHKNVFILGSLGSMVFVAILVVSYFLNPIYINNHLHQNADIYANYEFYFAVGSLCAGLFLQRLFVNLNAVSGIIILGIVSAICYAVCVFNYNIWVFLIIAFLIGFSNAGSRMLRVNYLFQRIPNQVIGRASSVFTVINTLIRAIFTFIFSMPFFIIDNNIVYAYLSFSIFLFLSTAILIFNYKVLIKNNL